GAVRRRQPERGLQFAAVGHLLDDVAAADQLAVDVELRDRRPVAVGLDAFADLAVGEHVDVRVLVQADAGQRRHRARGEAALRRRRLALHEQHDPVGVEQGLDAPAQGGIEGFGRHGGVSGTRGENRHSMSYAKCRASPSAGMRRRGAKPGSASRNARSMRRSTVAWSTASRWVATTVASGAASSTSRTMATSMTSGPLPFQSAPQAWTTTTAGRSAAMVAATSGQKMVSPAQYRVGSPGWLNTKPETSPMSPSTSGGPWRPPTRRTRTPSSVRVSGMGVTRV